MTNSEVYFSYIVVPQVKDAQHPDDLLNGDEHQVIRLNGELYFSTELRNMFWKVDNDGDVELVTIKLCDLCEEAVATKKEELGHYCDGCSAAQEEELEW